MLRRLTGAFARAAHRWGQTDEPGRAAVTPAEEPGTIDFQPIDPTGGGSADCRSFSLLTETWLRKRYDPVVYKQAADYVAKKRVTIVQADEDHIVAVTRGGLLYEQDLSFRENVLVGVCTCGDGILEPPGGSLSLCRHAVAVLLFHIAESGGRATERQNACLCPITRQELKAGDRIFQCQACHTAYSEAGWEFVRQTDRGRCCACRQAGTIRAMSARASRNV